VDHFTGSRRCGRPVQQAFGLSRPRSIILMVVAACALATVPTLGVSDSFEEAPPFWEPLLWGGKLLIGEDDFPSQVGPSEWSSDKSSGRPPDSEGALGPGSIQQSPMSGARGLIDMEAIIRASRPEFVAPAAPPVLSRGEVQFQKVYHRPPFRELVLKNIPPLYTSPALPGEGIWDRRDMPTGDNGWPLMYRTTYRPSIEYPNAIVHMLLFDMKQLRIKLYLGSAEPGGSEKSSRIEPESLPSLVAITNALWKQRHSGEAGCIFQGNVIKEMVPGMASLVVFRNGSVDVLEWNDTIPISEVQDAKQLKHLIVKDGKVVTRIVQSGQESDAEIGMGFLLVEEQPPSGGDMGMWGGMWGGYWNPGPMHTYGPEWFIATRSAFGIRKDGNLVFALGHHISTKDLAKALALAGCQRAIHGDANPFNVLGNLYYVDQGGNVYKKAKLSPDQNDHTLKRYVDTSYTSDFFGFFVKRGEKGPS